MSIQSSIASLREDRAAYTGDLRIPSQPIPYTFAQGAEVRIALAGNNRPMLLIPISVEEIRMELPLTEGLVMAFAQYKGASATSRYFLEVVSTDEKLESVFLDLVGNVCGRIQAGEGGRRALIRAIEEFRHLLGAAGSTVERQRIVGLFGELHFLKQALTINAKAVAYWTGPAGGRRDFLFPSVAVEVKTTESRDGRTVSIHSLGQLDKDDAEALLLAFYRIEENPATGITIGSVVEEICRMLSHQEPFQSRVENVGFTSTSAEAWNAIRFLVKEETIYQVDNGFPRIVPSSFSSALTPSISDVNYRLDLNGAEQYRLALHTVQEWLKG